MNLRAIIIDDEETGIETLKLQIEKHIVGLKIVAESTQSKEAIRLIEDYKPEIVFLDISMPEMNGFELLEKLEWRNFNLIFTTAHQEYALRALKQNAIDYLLKPIDQDDLSKAIEKIKTLVNSKTNRLLEFDYSSLKSAYYPPEKLGINSKEGIEYVDPLEIISFESYSNYTKIRLSDSKSILSPKTLGDFEKQLCHENVHFMRVHHSFVINLHKVSRYLKDKETIVMVNNQVIPLAKSKRAQFFKWLNP
jgi:two-component system, LytTR family, response regulator